jgi:putative transcriptional regulator
MTRKRKMSAEGAELLKAIKQMKAGKKGRIYTPEQLLAISARRSVNLTQKEFARLLNVSVDSVQDWEQGRRSPRGAAKTLLRVAHDHPEVLEQLVS